MPAASPAPPRPNLLLSEPVTTVPCPLASSPPFPCSSLSATAEASLLKPSSLLVLQQDSPPFFLLSQLRVHHVEMLRPRPNRGPPCPPGKGVAFKNDFKTPGCQEVGAWGCEELSRWEDPLVRSMLASQGRGMLPRPRAPRHRSFRKLHAPESSLGLALGPGRARRSG